jgi:hypothetical protein
VSTKPGQLQTRRTNLSRPLLLVVLNRIYFADGRGVRIEPRPSLRAALAKHVPALVQTFFDLAPSLSLGFAGALCSSCLKSSCSPAPQVTTIEAVRELALTLPRSYEALVRDRMKSMIRKRNIGYLATLKNLIESA